MPPPEERSPDAATAPDPADPWLAGFTLGDWWVDVSGNRLQRGDELRPLRHKAMALLLLLARHAGRTVSREQIIDAVWDGNRFVAPKAINTAVWTIRQTLGDDPDAPRYLETIAKKGYRLIAPVQLPVVPAATPEPRAATQPASPAAPAASPPVQPPLPLPLPPPLPAQPRAAALKPLVLGAVVLGGLLLAWVGWRPAPPEAAPPQATAPALPTPEVLTQEPGIEYIGALSPDGRQLAFAWWRGRGDGELHLRPIDAPTAAPQPLAAGHGDVTGLAWSPDGRALAFTALRADGTCRLWLQPLATDGAGTAAAGPARELAGCAALNTPSLAWSPDGRELVFSAERDGAGGLFGIAPDGSGLRRLSTAAPAAMPDHQPAWAPDGRHIAFVRQDPADGTRDLFELAPGGEPQRLTTLKLHFIHGLAHAADGRDLVFSTTRQDTRVLQRWQRTSGQVQPLGVEGSAPVRAADGSLVYALLRSHVGIARLPFRGLPVRTLQAVASDRVPRPDPTGARLAFVSRRGGAPELWLSGSDGQGARALTALGGVVDAPAWSPSGDRLAFIGACGPGRRVGLCTVRDDGSQLVPLAADAAGYGAPAWHPQRDEVWVASDRGGRWQLWRFAADGREAVVEPTELPPGRALQWLADGSGFVYQPRGEQHLRWRSIAGAPAAAERRLEVAASGEELVDWQLGAGSVTTLTRSERERWRRIELASGRRQALGEHPLGSFPERARFALAGPDAVWVEVANTQVADLMRLR